MTPSQVSPSWDVYSKAQSLCLRWWEGGRREWELTSLVPWLKSRDRRGPSIKLEWTKYSSGSLTRFSALPSGDFYFWRIFFPLCSHHLMALTILQASQLSDIWVCVTRSVVLRQQQHTGPRGKMIQAYPQRIISPWWTGTEHRQPRVLSTLSGHWQRRRVCNDCAIPRNPDV